MEKVGSATYRRKLFELIVNTNVRSFHAAPSVRAPLRGASFRHSQLVSVAAFSSARLEALVETMQLGGGLLKPGDAAQQPRHVRVHRFTRRSAGVLHYACKTAQYQQSPA
jgi:hypothetical protein